MEVNELYPLQLDGGTLSLSGIYFSFPNRPSIPVLSNLSVSVAEGKSLALVGSSGAGKSTVVAMVMRLYHPQAGSVQIGQTDITVSYLMIMYIYM